MKKNQLVILSLVLIVAIVAMLILLRGRTSDKIPKLQECAKALQDSIVCNPSK